MRWELKKNLATVEIDGLTYYYNSVFRARNGVYVVRLCVECRSLPIRHEMEHLLLYYGGYPFPGCLDDGPTACGGILVEYPPNYQNPMIDNPL